MPACVFSNSFLVTAAEPILLDHARAGRFGLANRSIRGPGIDNDDFRDGLERSANGSLDPDFFIKGTDVAGNGRTLIFWHGLDPALADPAGAGPCYRHAEALEIPPIRQGRGATPARI